MNDTYVVGDVHELLHEVRVAQPHDVLGAQVDGLERRDRDRVLQLEEGKGEGGYTLLVSEVVVGRMMCESSRVKVRTVTAWLGLYGSARISWGLWPCARSDETQPTVGREGENGKEED